MERNKLIWMSSWTTFCLGKKQLHKKLAKMKIYIKLHFFKTSYCNDCDVDCFLQTIKNVAKENASIKLQYNIVQKQLQESQISEKETSESTTTKRHFFFTNYFVHCKYCEIFQCFVCVCYIECLKLREMVNKLQNILQKRCNLEGNISAAKILFY